MAKRFTATEKWIDPWFCGLKPLEKLFWVYLLDNCDHAGVWQVNWPLVKFHLGEFEFNEQSFNGRIVKLTAEKWHIPKFITFQYASGLNPENRAHQSVITILKKEGAYKGLTRGIKGRTDMDMVKDTVKDKDKDKDKEEKGGMGEKEIIDDLNLILGTSYKPSSLKTKELIAARFNEGFTVDDFKKVHRNMFKRWGPDNKMREFLRPITLYSTKFESYLNMKQDLPISTAGAKTLMAGKEWLDKKENEDVGQKQVH